LTRPISAPARSVDPGGSPRRYLRTSTRHTALAQPSFASVRTYRHRGYSLAREDYCSQILTLPTGRWRSRWMTAIRRRRAQSQGVVRTYYDSTSEVRSIVVESTHTRNDVLRHIFLSINHQQFQVRDGCSPTCTATAGQTCRCSCEGDAMVAWVRAFTFTRRPSPQIHQHTSSHALRMHLCTLRSLSLVMCVLFCRVQATAYASCSQVP
jgi:hypothetical protein